MDGSGEDHHRRNHRDRSRGARSAKELNVWRLHRLPALAGLEDDAIAPPDTVAPAPNVEGTTDIMLIASSATDAATEPFFQTSNAVLACPASPAMLATATRLTGLVNSIPPPFAGVATQLTEMTVKRTTWLSTTCLSLIALGGGLLVMD